jgi:hypothetical protein
VECPPIRIRPRREVDALDAAGSGFNDAKFDAILGRAELPPIVRQFFLGLNPVTALRFQAPIAGPVMLKSINRQMVARASLAHS